MPGKLPSKKASDAERAEYKSRCGSLTRFNATLLQGGPNAWFCSDPTNVIDDPCLLSAMCFEFDKGTTYDDKGTLLQSPCGKAVLTVTQVAFSMFKV